MIYSDANAQDPKVNVHHHAITTATGTLRNHLGKAHREDYDKLCAQNGWKNNLAEADIQKAAKEKAVSQAAKREEFTVNGLLHRLVRFIVADDQVRSISLSYCVLICNLRSPYESWNVLNSDSLFSMRVQILLTQS
jgi:hypothetical protein